MGAGRTKSASQEREEDSKRPTAVQIRGRLTGFGFPRWRRLARWGDIQRVGREGRRIRGANLDFRFTASPLGHARVAIIVPRHGHAVVERNRVRRLLREHLRIALLSLLPSIDLVVRALPSAYATEGDALRRELGELSMQIRESDSK